MCGFFGIDLTVWYITHSQEDARCLISPPMLLIRSARLHAAGCLWGHLCLAVRVKCPLSEVLGLEVTQIWGIFASVQWEILGMEHTSKHKICFYVIQFSYLCLKVVLYHILSISLFLSVTYCMDQMWTFFGGEHDVSALNASDFGALCIKA